MGRKQSLAADRTDGAGRHLRRPTVMDGPQIKLLPDGRRLHLQHGPIDLVIEAFGGEEEVGAAYWQAADRFVLVLEELAGELGDLRLPVAESRWQPDGPIACRMMEAVWPHRKTFVTPMAAVAGAVADETMSALTDGREIAKAYINNSGDIAIHLTEGESLSLGIVNELDRPAIDGTAEFKFDQPVRGVATSGWRGRSWSFGIADAVTVLAPTAAAADVAATLIANAVNAEHPAVDRAPASEVDDNTDLGDRLVTVGVGDIDPAAIEEALDNGQVAASEMRASGLIHSAFMALRADVRVVGP